MYLNQDEGTVMNISFELGPIRPPSEAYSLLIRVTRNCPWNRCRFCHTYKGERFQLRTVEEIKQDIATARLIRDKIIELSRESGTGGDIKKTAGMVFNNSPNESLRNVALWIYDGSESAFLQDADSLVMRTSELVEVLQFLKETFPEIRRITSYTRSKTAARKKPEELLALHQSGLSRLHIGLESGYDPLLQYMDKGVTAAEHIKGGQNVVQSGISLSEYVVLGLGGKKWWREHAIQTAKILNEIDPDFIRVRTLTVNDRMPLRDDVESGSFIRLTDEEILEEENLFIEHLECHSNFVSDHITNLLQEIEGKLPEAKSKMLAAIDRFQSLSPEDKTNFIIGRRAGIYNSLDELSDEHKHQTVAQIAHKLGQDSDHVDNKTIYTLMEGFI